MRLNGDVAAKFESPASSRFSELIGRVAGHVTTT